MRTCLTCGEVYSDGVERCDVDGTALSGWSEGVVEARARDTIQMRNPNADSALRNPAGQRAETGAAAAESASDPEQREDEWQGHEPAAGRMLGERYSLKKEIGVGGFGAVFEAEDQRLHKRVAVKILSPQVTHQEEMLERFRREAIAASQVGHEGIVDVTDFDRDEDGTPFIVMEFLDGCDLADLLTRQRPLPIDRSLAIAAQVAFALDAAHRKRILHRDLKPANIYLVNRQSRADFVKIIDFGISKVMTPAVKASTLTSKGLILGTPHFMAPEQARGEAGIDGRVDVYSLGIILYAMIAGRPPFLGDTYLGVISQHLSEEPLPPSIHRGEIGGLAGLDDLVLRSIAKRPDDRFETMRDMGDAVLGILQSLNPTLAAAIRPVRVRSSRIQTAPAAPTVVAETEAKPPVEKRRLWIALPVVAAAAIAAIVLSRGGESQPGKAASAPAKPAATALDAGNVERLIEIRSDVDGAEAFTIEGELLGKLPKRMTAPTDEAGKAIVIRARGYQDRKVRLLRNTASPFEVSLELIAKAPALETKPEKKLAKKKRKRKKKKPKRGKERRNKGSGDIADQW